MRFKQPRLAVSLVAIALMAVLPLVTSKSQAATTTNLYLSPASQTVAPGSNLVVSLMLDSGGASINLVQSLLSYNPTDFSFVGITTGPAFTAPDSSYVTVFTNSESSGSIKFAAGPPAPSADNVTIPPVTGIQNVVTITLHANVSGAGTISSLGFNNSLCGPGPPANFTSTCTAAFDGVASGGPNDLLGSATPFTNGSYTISPLPVSSTSSSNTTTSSSSTGKTSSGGSTAGKSSSTGKSSSGSSSSQAGSSSTAAAAATPTTTTTNPVPVISDVKISDISSTGATVTWKTNIAATSVVKFGLNTNYGLSAQSSGLSTSHKVKLSAPFIAKGSTYYIEAQSATKAGASSTGGAQKFTAQTPRLQAAKSATGKTSHSPLLLVLYAVLILAAMAAAGTILVGPPAVVRRFLRRFGKGPGNKGSSDSGSGPTDGPLAGPPASPPNAVINPTPPPAEPVQPTPAPEPPTPPEAPPPSAPTVTGQIPPNRSDKLNFGKPDHPQPGTVITPNAGSKPEA